MSSTFRQRYTLFSIAVLICSAGWIWLSRAPAGSTTSGAIPAARQGFSAPDFSLQTLDGGIQTLSALRGSPVLVNIWASWCTPCKAEMPAFERIYQEFKGQGFTILGVNATDQDSLSNLDAFVQEYGLTFPILLDPQGEFSRLYQVHSLPTSYFVDRGGVIREVVIGGPMSDALLHIRVEQLLQKEP